MQANRYYDSKAGSLRRLAEAFIERGERVGAVVSSAISSYPECLGGQA
jgi:hypothetical protein